MNSDFDIARLRVAASLVAVWRLHWPEASCRVALVEAVPPDSAVQPSFDDRTIALSRGSYRILK